MVLLKPALYLSEIYFVFLLYIIGDMKIKDKITQSLASITVELQEISPDFLCYRCICYDFIRYRGRRNC